jgi:hypothetical protein
VSSDIQYINAENVKFTFVVQPENNFSNQGVLQIIFPEKLVLDPSLLTLTGGTPNIDASSAVVNVKYNHLVKVNSAFPNGYTSGDKIEFTISGVTNPPSTKPALPIHIAVYYEYTDEQGVV